MSYILLSEEAWPFFLLLFFFSNSPLETLLEDGQVVLQPSDLLPLEPRDFTIPVHVPEQRTGFLRS